VVHTSQTDRAADSNGLAELDALAGAVQRLFQPVLRMLVRRGIGARTATEVTKRAYVAATIDVLHERQLPVTPARLSVFTGMTQAEITQIQSALNGSSAAQTNTLTELATLLTVWFEDPKYSIAFTGTPIELEFDGPADRPSFTSLARECASQHPAKDLLVALVRTGAARINQETGRIQAVSRAFISEPYSQAAIARFERMVRNLVETSYWNFQSTDSAKRRFNRNTIADFSLHPDAEEEFRNLVQSEGQRFLESLDKWLQSQEEAPDNSRRVGVAAFHFVEPRGETLKEAHTQASADDGLTSHAPYGMRKPKDTSRPDNDSKPDVIDVLDYKGPKT
jgi:hypothetical protein